MGGRVSFNSNDEHDAMDGELVCRVLQLMNLTDARLSQVRHVILYRDENNIYDDFEAFGLKSFPSVDIDYLNRIQVVRLSCQSG